MLPCGSNEQKEAAFQIQNFVGLTGPVKANTGDTDHAHTHTKCYLECYASKNYRTYSYASLEEKHKIKNQQKNDTKIKMKLLHIIEKKA